jgi:chromosome segregation ATPase
MTLKHLAWVFYFYTPLALFLDYIGSFTNQNPNPMFDTIYNFDIQLCLGGSEDTIEEFTKLILNNNQKLTHIMAKIDELKQQVTDLNEQLNDLQETVDMEQAQIEALLETNASVVTELNNQIAALQAQLADSATPEQLQEVITSLEEMKDEIATTRADIEATVEGEETTSSTTTETTTEGPAPIL